MEEPGEQRTVVFALIVTELASECVCGGGGSHSPQIPPPPPGSVITDAKTTVHCSQGSCKYSDVCVFFV
jgi:hypothetical protein